MPLMKPTGSKLELINVQSSQILPNRLEDSDLDNKINNLSGTIGLAPVPILDCKYMDHLNKDPSLHGQLILKNTFRSKNNITDDFDPGL